MAVLAATAACTGVGAPETEVVTPEWRDRHAAVQRGPPSPARARALRTLERRLRDGSPDETEPALWIVHDDSLVELVPAVVRAVAGRDPSDEPEYGFGSDVGRAHRRPGRLREVRRRWKRWREEERERPARE